MKVDSQRIEKSQTGKSVTPGADSKNDKQKELEKMHAPDENTAKKLKVALSYLGSAGNT